MSGKKNEYVMELPIVPKTWLLKIKINFKGEGIVARVRIVPIVAKEAFSHFCRLSTIQTIPIP